MSKYKRKTFKCTVRTKQGERCTRSVHENSDMCWSHASQVEKPDEFFLKVLEGERWQVENQEKKKESAKKGFAAGRKPLTKEYILRIYELAKTGEYTQTELADHLDTKQAVIHYIANKLRKEGIPIRFRRSGWGRNPAWKEAVKELKEKVNAEPAADAVSDVDGDNPV